MSPTPPIEILVQMAIKSAIILAMAGTLSFLLRRRVSAAMRHLVWTIAAVALLVLPALTKVMPLWRIDILPASTLAFHASPALRTTPMPPDDLRTPAVSVQSVALPEITVSRPFDTRSWLPTIWLTGMMLTMLPWIIGELVIRRVARREFSPVIDGELFAMTRRLCDELRIARRVQLLTSRERSAMPMTWGWVRPVVYLPAEAQDWPPSRVRSVLLHELAHVRRWDCLTQLIGRLARAAYWFNPLAWVMTWRMRVDREAACDDVVLGAVENHAGGASYAEDLIQMARFSRASHFAGAIFMARPSQLRTRVAAILDETRNRSPISRRTLLWIIAVALMALMPFTLIETRAQTVQSPSPATQPASQPSATSRETEMLEQLAARRRALEAEIRRSQSSHSELASKQMIQEQLSQFSAAAVQARLAAIEAESQYAVGNPQLTRARQKVDILEEQREVALKKVRDLTLIEADIDHLKTELEDVRAEEAYWRARSLIPAGDRR